MAAPTCRQLLAQLPALSDRQGNGHRCVAQPRNPASPCSSLPARVARAGQAAPSPAGETGTAWWGGHPKPFLLPMSPTLKTWGLRDTGPIKDDGAQAGGQRPPLLTSPVTVLGH